MTPVESHTSRDALLIRYGRESVRHDEQRKPVHLTEASIPNNGSHVSVQFYGSNFTNYG